MDEHSLAHTREESRALIQLGPEESRLALECLRESYGIVAEPVDPGQLEKMGYQQVVLDGAARASGILRPVAGLLANRAMQGTCQQAFEGAYRLLIPAECAGMPRMELKKLVDQFGKDAQSMIFKGPDGRIAGHGGVQRLNAPDMQAFNLMQMVFAAASVVTNQYYLHNIDKKLGNIQKTASDILQFLERDQRNRLRADRETLAGYEAEMSILLRSEPLQRQPAIIEVQAIKRELLSFFYNYQEEFEAAIHEKKKGREEKRSKLQLCFEALYVYGRAVVIETLLTQRMDREHLRGMRKLLLDQAAAFEGMYNRNHGEIVKLYQAVDRALANAAAFNGRTYTLVVTAPLRDLAGSLDWLDALYNGPADVAVVGEQVYFKAPERLPQPRGVRVELPSALPVRTFEINGDLRR